MKTLLLIRHAKSSWENPYLSDFDRPLNKRGKHDAPLMGGILKEKNMIPDTIYSSPAVRALETAKKVAEKLNYKKSRIIHIDELYHASSNGILAVLRQADANIQRLVAVCHNPGITELVNYFLDKSIENVPTTGIVAIRFNVGCWDQISPQNASFISFDYPKQYYPKKEA